MDNSNVNIDLIRDHVDTIILSTLAKEDRYGLDILTEIKEKSKGLYELKQPTLYSCLKRLEKLGYIKSYKGDTSNGAQRVYYALLDDGRAFLENDQYQWEYSRTIINGLLSSKEFDPEQEPPFKASDLRPRTKRQPKSELSAEEAADVYEHQIKIENNEEDNSEITVIRDVDSLNQGNNSLLNSETYAQDMRILNPELKSVIVNKDSVVYEEPVDYVNVFDGIFNGNNSPDLGFDYDSSYGYNSSSESDQNYINQYSMDVIAKKFQNEGFILKPYYKKNTTEFYVNKYIYINRILLSVSAISYVLFALLLTIFHVSSASKLGTSIGSLFAALGSMLIVPLYFLGSYFLSPDKRVVANFNIKKTLAYASIFLIDAILLIVLIGFIGFKANFTNPISLLKPVVFPTILILLIPLSIVIYSFLYSTRRYHVN